MINSKSGEDEDVNKLYKHDASLILTALSSGMAGKFMGSFVGIGLIIFLKGSEMKLDGMGKCLSIGLIIFVWIILVGFKSKNIKLAIASLVASSLLLNKVIKLAEAPKEINLGALSILPMMALF